MVEPYTQLLTFIHYEVATSTIVSTKPVIFDVLKLFTLNEDLGSIFMSYCKPTNAAMGSSYANTLLGALLSISVLPKVNTGPYEFFQNPMDPVMCPK